MREKLLLRFLGLVEAHEYTLEQSHRSPPFSVVVGNTTIEDEGLCGYLSAKTVRSIDQTFKVLGYIGQNKAFSQATVKALRTIKFCAFAIIGFVAVGELFLLLGNSDDRAGGVFIGILITFGSAVIATAAAMFERILQNAVDTKSENDLTV